MKRFADTSRPSLLVSFLLLCCLLFSFGCSQGGGMSLLAITPAGTQIIDAGQVLSFQASIVNDAANSGVSFATTGGGTVGTATTTRVGDSSIIVASYTAPSVTATTTATVTAASVNTPSQTATLTLTVYPALHITTTTLPGGNVNTVYTTTTLLSSGGSGSLRWSVITGTLPTGLSLNTTTGAISGTPTAAGTFTFSINLLDASLVQVPVTQSYTVVILPQPPSVTTTSLPNAIAGSSYSQQLTYTGGGTGTATWVETGTLPAGLTLSTSGLLSGTPTNASAGAVYPFSVAVTVGTQTSASQPLSITAPALPTVTTTTLPSGYIGISYSQQLASSGGSGATPSWAITSGSLPASSGLTLRTSGLISGTPTTATAYNFSVAVTIGTQTSAAQQLMLTVSSLAVTSGSTATGEVGLPFNFKLTAAGGTGPYTWSLASGSSSLPSGLTLNTSTGVISGSPTTATGSPFTGITLQVTDSLSATATQAMTFVVNTARGSTNNSELSGQYAFLLSGFSATGAPLAVAGKFTADGNGNIVSGVMDTNGTALTALSANVALVAGTFSIGADNRGKLTLVTAGGTSTFVVSLNSVSGGVAAGGNLAEFDASGLSLTGELARQTPSAFSSASITGGYAFGEAGFAVNSTPASLLRRTVAGAIQFNGSGGISSAEFLSNGAVNTTPNTPVSGTLVVGTNGRGTLALVQASGAGTINYVIYVISAGKFFLLSSDPASGTTGANDLLSGQALAQTISNGSFGLTSLSGTAVMHTEELKATSSGTPFADIQLGLYTFNGTGMVTLNSDENAGGAIDTNTLSGTYTVATNGRVTVTLAASGIGGCADCIGGKTYFYLVGGSMGFVMDFSSSGTSGSFEPMTVTTPTNASLFGSYALGTIAPLTQTALYLVAEVNFNGAGMATGTSDINSNGTLSADDPLSAPYSVASSGRTTYNLAGDASVVYIVSSGRAYLLDLATTQPAIVEAQQ